MKPSEAPAAKAHQSLNKALFPKLQLLFRNVHALNVKARPHVDYIWMNELDEKKGMEIGEKYRSAYACREFTSAIASVSRVAVLQYLASCNFMSVIVDGSSNSSFTENEMVYIHTCYRGDVKTNFIKCCQVQRGTALGIVNAIRRSAETVMEYDTFLSKLVPMGSDGVTVMLRKKSGVLALLKEQQPSLIGVHCSAHRLELSYKDAIKKVPLADKVLTLLTGLYYMYRNSPLNRTNLKNAFKCLNIKAKLPTRAGGTRWVGHILKALSHFLDGYPALQLHLEQLAASKEKSDSKPKALGFLKLLRSRDIIAMSLFLQDLLTILHKVSLKFQQDGSVVSEVAFCIHTAIKTIQRFHNTDGPFLQKLPNFATSSNPSAGATTRQTYTLTAGTGTIGTERKVLVDALCAALESQFDDTSVVKATAIADFKMWPANEEELHTFGDDWMNTLLHQFSSYLNNEEDQIKTEWPMLKMAVLKAFLLPSHTTTWSQVNRRFQDEYPHVLEFL